MEILHNNIITELNGLSSKELEEYYNNNPWKYYQSYVAGSISPYYDAKLACIGAAEEFCEFLNSTTREEAISEAGDLLFQLTNIANFYNITISEENLNIRYLKNISDSLANIRASFGDILSAIMKMARYPDYQEVFQRKWGMTAEERIKTKILDTICYLNSYTWSAFAMSWKDIMDYNLRKLDERHSADGDYYFGCAYGLTRSDGGNKCR